MLATLTAYITHHAPAWAQGDTGIEILCAWAITAAYLYHYARRKGAI